MPLAIVGLLTLVIRVSGVDLALQQAIYTAGEQSWIFGKIFLWQFLYKVGSIPALAVVVASVIGVILSAYRTSWRQWRRVFIFNILLFALGPGVVANGILKEYWGRPRPREVKELGGRSQFEPVLTIDRSSDGKAFPSGHATMGFYFVGGFFLLRRHRRRIALAVMEAAIAFGGLIGVARMVQGGHFLSDVIWAFVVCYVVALGLYYALGLHNGLWREGASTRVMPVWQRVAMVVVGLCAIAAVALATPYRATRNLYLLEEASKNLPVHLVVGFTEGEHVFQAGDELRITGEAYGHGIPTSSIAAVFWEGLRRGNAQVIYSERISGWFSEVNEQLNFSVPWERLASLEVDSGNAFVTFHVGSIRGDTPIEVKSGRGELTFKLEGRPLEIEAGEQVSIEGREKLENRVSGGEVVRLKVEDEFSGRILIED